MTGKCLYQIFFILFYFIFKLYNIVLFLPNIEMNMPQDFNLNALAFYLYGV